MQNPGNCLQKNGILQPDLGSRQPLQANGGALCPANLRPHERRHLTQRLARNTTSGRARGRSKGSPDARAALLHPFAPQAVLCEVAARLRNGEATSPLLTTRTLTSAFEMQLYSRAPLLSQSSRLLNSAHFRALLLRRQRLPLPIAPRTCACRGHPRSFRRSHG